MDPRCGEGSARPMTWPVAVPRSSMISGTASPVRLPQAERRPAQLRVAVAAVAAGAGTAPATFSATLMLEGRADIRHIQAMLGHAELSTTQIYAEVSIRVLQTVHDATHPGASTIRPLRLATCPSLPRVATASSSSCSSLWSLKKIKRTAPSTTAVNGARRKLESPASSQPRRPRMPTVCSADDS